jgi:hypothetical protein
MAEGPGSTSYGTMARAVRIARTDTPGVSPPSSGEEIVEGYQPNLGGLTRAGRLFALFVVVLVVSYSVFLGLLWSSPSPSAADPSLELLSVLAALLAIGGFWITLVRTPRGIERRAGRLIVVEFLGGRRVYTLDPSIRFTVENRYGTGLLSSAPTEMVSIQSLQGPVRHYLVERDLLPVERPWGAD